VFCARNDAGPSVERVISACNIDNAAPAFANSMRNTLSGMDTATCQAWATNQAYIALGIGLAAAAELRIGSCPMSGFVPADVHRVMKLPSNQWPVAYLALGSALDDQPSKDILRFRLPMEELFQHHPSESKQD
jgi:nitroreductase / dihydropteridine reductase